MKDIEVTQWQRAVKLYRRALDESQSLVVETLDESDEVKEKLQQLLDSLNKKSLHHVSGPLDDLILRLGFDDRSDAEIKALDDSIIGRRIGDWSVISRLGQGGMASVYLAERSDVEFHQQGALKLLSLLMLATGGASRFVQEQQFLAQLKHPNIAMLLDGGVADDGTPYLVTELVDGVDVSEYCQQHALGAHHIVLLLIRICNAVSHAHAKLIVHRDIKPSNILVGNDGQPKLLDFGIGKLVEGVDDNTMTRIYTPRYAAPEQRDGRAVTTATDVYGLGVLGQTLLGDQLHAHRELARVLEQARHADIDRRYRSVESLVADLTNWLESRPVSAVSDSLAYRTRKFIYRNKAAVTAGAMMLTLTVIAAAAVLWQANNARSEALKARTVSTFMIELFQNGDLFTGEGPDTPISSLMSAGAKLAREELQNAPAARSEVLRVIGLAQTEFGDYAQAGENLRAALDSAAQPLDRARALGSLGVWSAEQAEFDKGIEMLQASLDIFEGKLPASHPDRLEVETDLINFLLFTGEFQQSMDRADALVDEIGQLDSLQPNDHANVLRSRAMALTQVARLDEAIVDLEKAIEIASALRPARPALVSAYYNDLGVAYSYRGDAGLAVESFEHSHSAQVAIYGAAHKRTLTSGSNLVLSMRAAGQLDRAVRLATELVEISQATHGTVNRSTINARFALALVLSDSGGHSSADEQLRASIQALRQLDDLRSELPNHLAWRAELLIRLGQFDPAISLLQESESIREQEFPDVARRYRVASQRRLVQAHAALDQCETAQTQLTAILDELAAGKRDELVATRIYFLNCEPAADRITKFKQLQAEAAGLQSRDAGLLAALSWGEKRFNP